MGIAINGNTVNGLAIGGQAFYSLTEDQKSKLNSKSFVDLSTASWGIDKVDSYDFTINNTYVNVNFSNFQLRTNCKLYQVQITARNEMSQMWDGVSSLFSLEDDDSIDVPSSGGNKISIFLSDGTLSISIDNFSQYVTNAYVCVYGYYL